MAAPGLREPSYRVEPPHRGCRSKLKGVTGDALTHDYEHITSYSPTWCRDQNPGSRTSASHRHVKLDDVSTYEVCRAAKTDY
jgi:hypothetical protein